MFTFPKRHRQSKERKNRNCHHFFSQLPFSSIASLFWVHSLVSTCGVKWRNEQINLFIFCMAIFWVSPHYFILFNVRILCSLSVCPCQKVSPVQFSDHISLHLIDCSRKWKMYRIMNDRSSCVSGMFVCLLLRSNVLLPQWRKWFRYTIKMTFNFEELAMNCLFLNIYFCVRTRTHIRCSCIASFACCDNDATIHSAANKNTHIETVHI